ncbi:MAG: DUF916 and DUF3324 domain-containing protein [Lactobacillales bacterium]|jgi:uncharacterized integral membrane protein|nr:DUF916 and DUF3324 domain-containing protein [Lactobacillales bacterium]
MQKINKGIVVLLALLVGILFGGSSLSVQAGEWDTGYTVGIVGSEFQHETKPYYDLRLKPKQKTELGITIKNALDTSADFKISVNTAVTNSNGIIDYSGQEKADDNSLFVKLSDIAKLEKDYVSLAPKQEITVPIQVTMPDKPFDGMILGGIHVTRGLTDKERKDSGYNNVFSYVKQIKITETDKEITPDLKLTKVTSSSENFKGEIRANLQNPTATILSKIKIQAKILAADSKKVVNEREQLQRDMAPNSNFDYYFEYLDGKLPVGKFDMVIDAEDEFGHKWHLVKTFEVSAEEQEKVKQETHTLKSEKEANPWVWVVIVMGIIIVILLIIVILFLIRKKATETNEAGEGRK